MTDSIETSEAEALPFRTTTQPKASAFTSIVMVEIHHGSAIPNLADHVGNRASTIQGVERVANFIVEPAEQPSRLLTAARDLLNSFGGLRAPDHMIAEVEALAEAVQAEEAA